MTKEEKENYVKLGRHYYDMTRDDAIEIIKILKPNMRFDDLGWIYVKQALKMAISALEQMPCEDAVSRDAVIDALSDYVLFEEYEDKSHTFTVKPLIKRIVKLPSVTQKSGKWIDREVYDADRWKCCRWKCSECGRTELYKENFCPNCGAKMVEPQESEDKK